MMTVAYITILDTFTPYDATFAVIRIVLIGFFMLGARPDLILERRVRIPLQPKPIQIKEETISGQMFLAV